MPKATFAKAFPFTVGLDTTYYEAGWSGEVSKEVATAARAARVLKKEKAGGSDQGREKGDAGSAES